MSANSEKQIKNPPARFHSKVWKHFGFYQNDDGKTLDKTHAICKHCRYKVKYSSNTSNLQSHLDHHHADLGSATAVIRPNQPQIADSLQTKLPFGCPRARRITRSIATFICKDLRPYSVVERHGFRRMVNTLEPRYEIPSRKYFTETTIPELYKETREMVQDALEPALRVALTCDGWTSRSTVSFVTFTAHFIDDDWQLQSYVLQTREMNESHTGRNMAKVLKNAAAEWKLTEKDPAVVTDNAANMCLAVELSGYHHVRCFAHVLNLAVQRALKLPNIDQLLGKVRRITSFFHRSPPAGKNKT